ncbi:MAG TPA: type II secretion system secretin GspD [Spongiibacteraceae bacterium]|jgi:general secretion pathway protein D|nr:type II secretion system secretin GspD [Spongiibacteraceae bacterium]HUH38820.1 type II secretion system secretin GspD [Spongiibacteraceae bacterium]
MKAVLRIACLLLLWLPQLALSEQTWTVNFKNSDIQEVIKFIADATGKTVIIDPQVKGWVKVISDKPLNQDELYQLFLSILEVHGFAAISSGDVVRVVLAKDAAAAPGPVVDASGAADPNYVTQVIQLRNVAASRVLPVVRPLVPRDAHIAAYEPNNAIVISAPANAIARLVEVIDRIDQTAIATTETVDLEYAQAETVVKMIEALQSGDAAQGKTAVNGLRVVADKRINSVLLTGGDMERARAKVLIARLDRPGPQLGNVRVVYLEYAKATQLAQVLTSIVQNLDQVAAPGETARKASIEADEDTNSLLITAAPETLDELLSVVKRLDIRRAQVLVEAIIVEMENTDGRKLGVQWMFQNGKSGSFGSFADPGADDAALANVARAALNGNTGDLAGALGSMAGSTLGIGRLDDGLSFVALLNALEQDSGANILSTPNLLTLDNHAASIVVGQNVPLLTGSYSGTGGGSTPDNPFQTIERQSIGTSLEVTPHINKGNSIVLDIVQEVSSLSGATTVDVITNERKISTRILVTEGEIAVLGGLIRDDVQQSEQRVPLLGSLPVLGRAFRNTVTTVVKTNLVVFIRATVIRDPEALQGATAEKYRYIRELQLQRQGSRFGDIEAGQLPLLPEWPGAIDLREAAATTDPAP